MASFQQLDQAIYTSAKRYAWAIQNWLRTQVGWFPPEANAIDGDWSTPGDALVTGDSIILESPAGAPFRLQIKMTLVIPGAEAPHLLFELAPWVGVAGGWDDPDFTEPFVQSGKMYLWGGAGTPAIKGTIVASDSVIIPSAWWTPSAGAIANLSFVNGTKKITRAAGSWLDVGIVPGGFFTVTGSASNNTTFCAKTVDATEIVCTAAPVTEGPVTATVTPLEHATMARAGRVSPRESVTVDVRPASAWAGLWGMHYSRAATFAIGIDSMTLGAFASHKRIHAYTGGGYVKLISGAVTLPAVYGQGSTFFAIDKEVPFSTNEPLPAAELYFNETASAALRVEHAGYLEGLYLARTPLLKQLLSQTLILPNGKPVTQYFMARDGVAQVWPCGLDMI